MAHGEHQYVTLADGGRMLAQADVLADPDTGVVHAWLHVESGHLPSGTRSRLVDAVLDLPGLPPGARLQVAVPIGDCEIVERVRQRCTAVELRSAGASCLVDGTITAPTG